MAKSFKFLSKIASPEYHDQIEALIVELGLVPPCFVTDEVVRAWNQKFFDAQATQCLSKIDREIRTEFMEYFVEQYHHKKDYYSKQSGDTCPKQLHFGF